MKGFIKMKKLLLLLILPSFLWADPIEKAPRKKTQRSDPNKTTILQKNIPNIGDSTFVPDGRTPDRPIWRAQEEHIAKQRMAFEAQIAAYQAQLSRYGGSSSNLAYQQSLEAQIRELREQVANLNREMAILKASRR
jgi:hypothetical protein